MWFSQFSVLSKKLVYSAQLCPHMKPKIQQKLFCTLAAECVEVRQKRENWISIFLIKISQYFINSRSLLELLVAAGEESSWECVWLYCSTVLAVHTELDSSHTFHISRRTSKNTQKILNTWSPLKKLFHAFSLLLLFLLCVRVEQTRSQDVNSEHALKSNTVKVKHENLVTLYATSWNFLSLYDKHNTSNMTSHSCCVTIESARFE